MQFEPVLFKGLLYILYKCPKRQIENLWKCFRLEQTKEACRN